MATKNANSGSGNGNANGKGATKLVSAEMHNEIRRQKKASQKANAKANAVSKSGGSPGAATLITSEKRVNGIRKELTTEALNRLAFMGIELGYTGTNYLALLLGNESEWDGHMAVEWMTIVEEDTMIARPIQQAFVHAYRLVDDAQFIIALPGRSRSFFNELMACKDQELKEMKRRTKRKPHKDSKSAANTSNVVATTVAKASGFVTA